MNSSIWKKYKLNLAAMSAFVAWLWIFPLFGICQANLPGKGSQLITFNYAFLFGLAMSFLLMLFIRENRLIKLLTCLSPILNLILTIAIALISSLIPPENFTSPLLSFFVYYFAPVIMGAATAVYFTSWGTTIFHVPPNEKGRYMGTMILGASLTSIIITTVFLFSALPAMLLTGLILFIPAISQQFFNFTETVKNTPDNYSVSALLKPWKNFWLPFAFILLCYYVLSWVTHQSVFPFIREENVFAPVLGYVFYGLISLGAGILLDREEEVEKFALLGLAMLGCTFLFLPVAIKFQILLPLQFLLEGSYALIDLFLWVTLAIAACYFQGNPRQYYALGLFLNIAFILAGTGLTPFLGGQTGEYSFFYLSVFAGIILFAGTIPVRSLRKIKRIPEEKTGLLGLSEEINNLINTEDFSIEIFTQKEKEIIYLMLSGFKNTAIEKKLHISRNTLKTHIRHIYSKAAVKTRSELILKFHHFKSDI
ncbi:MAG: LuxR C-terminal-related transcriptional regulator [Firmicutes bacterium]|nr:LuxR C-terminal-related transcriptional regulator [Bacillota bacterium]